MIVSPIRTVTQNLAVGSLLGLFCQTSTFAESFQGNQIVNIRNPSGDVRYNRSQEPSKVNWSSNINKRQNEYLLPNNWLSTGKNSETDLVLGYISVAYFQGSSTQTRFNPTLKCPLQLAGGTVLILLKDDKNQLQNNCFAKTPNAQVGVQTPNTHVGLEGTKQSILIKSTKIGQLESWGFHSGIAIQSFADNRFSQRIAQSESSRGTALFVQQNSQGTLVGSLTDSPNISVIVSNGQDTNRVELKAGELAKVTFNGNVEKLGFFDLRTFYRTSKLALGLGSGKKHEERVNQERDQVLKDIIEVVRVATLGAVRKQAEASGVGSGEVPQNIPVCSTIPELRDLPNVTTCLP